MKVEGFIRDHMKSVIHVFSKANAWILAEILALLAGKLKLGKLWILQYYH